MLRELISILRTKDPLQAVGENFAQMLHLTYEMTLVAGDIYFGKKYDPADRSQIYRQDVEVNQLERTIRQQVVAHLSIQKSSSDLPYCLLLMSLVKDVERLGDYAKNLTEVQDICSHPLPDDGIKQELMEIRSGVEKAFQSTADVLASSSRNERCSSSGKVAASRTAVEHFSGASPHALPALRHHRRGIGLSILQTDWRPCAQHSLQCRHAAPQD